MRKLARKTSPQLCLAEGRRTVAAALRAGAAVRELLVAPALLRAEDEALVLWADRLGIEVIEVGADAFATVIPHRRPDGLIATVERPPAALWDIRLPASPLIAVAVGIERPGNLGTIIRTACASGADAVIVADPCTDLYHPDVVRGSLGAVFHVATATSDTSTALAWLGDQHVRILATTPRGETPYWRAPYGGGIALIMGSERHGLPVEWLRRADLRLAIPMTGEPDSLNVAIAAGIVLFEASRRRA
ncbi:MAG TPA: TrmH family RNA methyltransferase [Gaiellaceae bacterium]|nr:TrmH family RNA methyltransferase [Gaiellaceae bacterium]